MILYNYKDQLIVCHDHIIAGRTINVTVKEIIDYHNILMIVVENGNYIYYKNLRFLMFYDHMFCCMYDGYICYMYAKDENEYLSSFVGEAIILQDHIESLADFVRVLRDERGIEFDPKKVDYGTLIYKKIDPDKMIRLNSFALNDIDII